MNLFKKKHLKLSIIFLLSLSIIPTHLLSTVRATQYSCVETPDVIIFASNNNMVNHVCDAAKQTIRFLGKYNLKPKRPIKIDIIEEVINQGGYKAFGSYNRQIDRISMMSLPTLLESSESPQMYNMPFDEEHYTGAIAHELTHAIFHHNSSEIEEKWNNAAQEYLAHTTQLAVLPKQKREKIINSENTGPWETGDEISVTYMGFNTTGFAVKSYLHLTQMKDPQSFVQVLLNHKWLYISVP